jgi:hypothetical protein
MYSTEHAFSGCAFPLSQKSFHDVLVEQLLSICSTKISQEIFFGINSILSVGKKKEWKP